LIVVDLQEATGSVDADGVEADVVEARLPARRDQELLGLERQVAAGDVEPFAVVRDSVDRDAGAHVHALGRQHVGDQLGRLRLLDSQDAGCHLQHDDVGAESRERLGQLEPDRAATYDDQRCGCGGRLQRIAVRPERSVGETVDRRDGRRGAGVEHDPAGCHDALDAVGRLHLDRALPGQSAVATQQPGAGRGQTVGGNGVVPVGGGLLADAARHGGEVRGHLGMTGQPVDPSGFGQRVRSSDEHLRRDAAPVGTLTSDQLCLDGHHVEAGLRQPRGQRLTSGPQAHDDDIALAHAAIMRYPAGFTT
jgi:hypothetical protein